MNPMPLLGKKTCNHQSTAPFRTRRTKESGHGGKHGARGLSWGADGKIALGSKSGGRK